MSRSSRSVDPHVGSTRQTGRSAITRNQTNLIALSNLKRKKAQVPDLELEFRAKPSLWSKPPDQWIRRPGQCQELWDILSAEQKHYVRNEEEQASQRRRARREAKRARTANIEQAENSSALLSEDGPGPGPPGVEIAVPVQILPLNLTPVQNLTTASPQSSGGVSCSSRPGVSHSSRSNSSKPRQLLRRNNEKSAFVESLWTYPDDFCHVEIAPLHVIHFNRPEELYTCS